MKNISVVRQAVGHVVSFSIPPLIDMPEPEDEGIHVCGPSVEVLDWAGGIAPAPLLPGEDEAEYALLTARIRAAARPDDFIEQLLVRDVIDLSWEIFRLRRLKSGVLRIASNDGVSSIFLNRSTRRSLETMGSAENSPKTREMQIMLARRPDGQAQLKLHALGLTKEEFENTLKDALFITQASSMTNNRVVYKNRPKRSDTIEQVE